MSTTAEIEAGRRDALAERLLGACTGALDLLHVYVGDRLGLYRALVEEGATPAELARRCGIDQRYAREWLEHQAAARILDVDDPGDPGDGNGADRRYSLSPGHAEVLVDADNLSYLSPLALGVVSVAQTLPRVLDAFRTGDGVPFDAYGPDIRHFISRVNRPMFLHLLASEWFPQVPGLVERLEAAPPARVADVGCGTGWSSIAIALGFPSVEVVGLDLDKMSVAEATANAEASGVGERVRFEVRNAADPALAGRFDLVCAFETIHDMCDPVGALRAMRSLRAEGGTVLVADERVADHFTVDADDVERFQFGWSALHCLPTALTAPPAAGTGTIMRTPVFRRYALEAGFTDVEVLPIENDFWRFYRLTG
jgi:SAM-dependent methyltransferase